MLYGNKTTDMIVYESISNVNGFDYVVSNSGGMKTFGAELSLNTRVVNSS